MDKNLALAMDFKSAPKSLQDAATSQYENEKALVKAQQKLADAQKAVIDAQSVVDQGYQIFRKELSSWDPQASALKASAVKV